MRITGYGGLITELRRRPSDPEQTVHVTAVMTIAQTVEMLFDPAQMHVGGRVLDSGGGPDSAGGLDAISSWLGAEQDDVRMVGVPLLAEVLRLGGGARRRGVGRGPAVDGLWLLKSLADQLTPMPDQESRIESVPAGFTMERRWLPDADGALTARVSHTNVPRTVTAASACEFDWGNSGPGARELAVNLLEAALRDMAHGGPRSTALDGTCFTLALILSGKFVAAFLRGMPNEGGSIELHSITEWIGDEQHHLDPDVRALIAPRYCLPGSEGQHWSSLELSAILGTPLTVRVDGLYAAETRVAVPAVPHPLSAACWESPPI